MEDSATDSLSPASSHKCRPSEDGSDTEGWDPWDGVTYFMTNMFAAWAASRDDEANTFTGNELVEWLQETFGISTSRAVALGDMMAGCGMFDQESQRTTRFSLGSVRYTVRQAVAKYFVRDKPVPPSVPVHKMIGSPTVRARSSGGSLSSSGVIRQPSFRTPGIEQCVMIFQEPPADASEEEIDTRNFIGEGLFYFHPSTIERTQQEQLVSGVVTLLGVVRHITPRTSLPTPATGLPILKFAAANLCIVQLAAGERGIHLVVGAPETTSDESLRRKTEVYRNTLLALHGPTDGLWDRLPESSFRLELERSGSALVSMRQTPLFSCPFYPAQTSISVYQQGTRCTASSMSGMAKAMRLIDLLLEDPAVHGAAVLYDGRVVGYELPLPVLHTVTLLLAQRRPGVVKASPASQSGSIGTPLTPSPCSMASGASASAFTPPPTPNPPYVTNASKAGLRSVSYDPIRFKWTVNVSQSELIETAPLYVRKEHFNEMLRTRPAPPEGRSGRHTPPLNENPPLIPRVLIDDDTPPSPRGGQLVGGKDCRITGLYLHHFQRCTVAVVLPIDAMLRKVTDLELRSTIQTSLQAVNAALPTLEEGWQGDGCSDFEGRTSSEAWAIYDSDEGSAQGFAPDSAFSNDLAFSHSMLNGFEYNGGQCINRFLATRPQEKTFLFARNVMGRQCFYRSAPGAKLSTVEGKAREVLAAMPVLL